jgi:hypothetical protein
MSDADFDEVLDTSRRWMQAWMDQDREVLDSILAPDYALVISTIPTVPFERPAWLETAVGAYVCTRFVYDGVHMRRVADDLIIMSAIADFDATIGGIDRSGRYWVTDVWRRSDDGWKICARYSYRPGGPDASVRALAEAQGR